MLRPPFAPTIEALPRLVPFVGPEAMERQRGRPFLARLGANESILGPSPKALAAMHAAVGENWKYSDPENYELRSAIAAHHSVAIENVVVGEGIDGLLGLTCQLFLRPGDGVVTTDGAYPTFNFHVRVHGGALHLVPMKAFKEDIERLIDTAKAKRARIIYVSNPNNPMGTWWTSDELQDIISIIPPQMLLVIDEAYCDTAPSGTVPPIDVANPQVLRYRTFSKAYGMAGARIGYAIGDRGVIEGFEKVRNHYGINRVGQVGARAALLDQEYLRMVAKRIADGRDAIAAIASNNILSTVKSAASFVAIDCGRDGAFAQRVLQGLLDRDVFVRKPVTRGLEQFIRVSVGPDKDLAVLAGALPEALLDARRQD